ncbi:MAG: guanylate kinase [Candidatus Gracilibacteria bacterium]
MPGKLFLILGSSGSGKGTVLEALHKDCKQYVFPLSCTTRPRRPGERDGDIYHFVTKADFEGRIEKGEFLEYATVHQDNYYGTLKAPILRALEDGKTVVREVDVQGLRSIRNLISKEHLVSVFLTVSDWEILRQRILKRSPMSVEEISHRYESYLIEMSWAKECDFVVESVEGHIEKLIADVKEIIEKNAGSQRFEGLF